MYNMNSLKRLGLLLAAMASMGGVWGQSQPSPPVSCGEYQWPAMQSPCPEVQIKQKHDHTSLARYRHKGWDTVVTCEERQIVLSCMPYIPPRKFNGTYYVDPIPYDPPDPTFHAGTRMPVGTDDNFANVYTSIPYPFYFFGIQKTQFCMGANGLIVFNSNVPVTNNAGSTGPSCPWSYSAGLPWTDNTSGAPSNLNYMRDAIYGIYEDTYPSSSVHGSTGDANWGLYYGIQDEYPCRKIICSWNDVPQFSCTSLRCKYQIVCYEGSNIIEVHVAQRQVCTGWNGGNGIIGIQNATGQLQQPGPANASNSHVMPGSPSAFFPTGMNPTTSSLQNVAYRFTPAGLNTPNYGWRRIFDDGRPDVELRNAWVYPEAMDDTNGYYEPMDEFGTCPTLTKAYLSPKEPSKYVFWTIFKNANNDDYVLADTVFIGVDTVDYLDLHKLKIDDTIPSELSVCLGDTARLRMDITSLQEVAHEEWRIQRISGGDTVTIDSLEATGRMSLPARNYLQVGNWRSMEAFRITPTGDTLVMDTTLFSKKDYEKVGDTIKVRQIDLFTNRLPDTLLRANKIDSLIIQITADYASGCHSFDTMLVRVFPNFDTIITEGICRGDTFTWDTNGHTYMKLTQSTNPETTLVHLKSTPGCDSTVHMKLTVYDVSHTVDHVMDCKPIVWKNGKTYTTGNAATASQDTVRLTNKYGCDSIVQLDFVIHPLTAKIHSNIENFTLDNLDAVLTDISTGDAGRIWQFPNGPDQTGVNAYYSIPAEMDGAEITMIAQSEYGCLDTAKIYLPLNKEHFWVPNAFTPDNPAGNNVFASVSTKTLNQEMLIYNRRGELVFRCTGVDCGWDGRDMDGNPCIQGAYVYIIRYTNEFEPKNTRVLQGTVTLIR